MTIEMNTLHAVDYAQFMKHKHPEKSAEQIHNQLALVQNPELVKYLLPVLQFIRQCIIEWQGYTKPYTAKDYAAQQLEVIDKVIQQNKAFRVD